MKISIITICYNSAQHIRSAIESALAQTYPGQGIAGQARNDRLATGQAHNDKAGLLRFARNDGIEYIIVDGNSTDNTLAIVKSYEPAFAGRLKWVSEPDHGLYDAINKGIRMATGEIVGILHSDDFYNHPHCISTVAQAFEDAAIDACFADVHFVKPDRLDKTVRYYSSARFKPSQFRWGFMPAHPTFFVRKKYFEEYGYYKTDYQIAADYELLIRFLYTHHLKYQYIPLDMITMRMGGKSTRSLKSNYILNREIVRACKENGIYTNLFLVSLKYFRKIFELSYEL